MARRIGNYTESAPFSLQDRVETVFDRDAKSIATRELTNCSEVEIQQTLNPPKETNNQSLSMLSPHREDEEEEISPFSSKYQSIKDEEQEIEDEQEEAILENRYFFYMVCFGVLYVLALAVGYYMTPISDGVPQVVTIEQRDENDYLADSNAYLTSLQGIHAEAIDAVESYTNGIIGVSELNTRIKQQNEKMEKMKEEMKELKIPPRYEHLHAELLNLYSAQLAFSTSALAYGDDVNAFDTLVEVNEDYEDRMIDYLSMIEREIL